MSDNKQILSKPDIDSSDRMMHGSGRQLNIAGSNIHTLIVEQGSPSAPEIISAKTASAPTSIKRVRQPIRDMMETETYKKVRQKIQNKKAVVLHCHGFPGSGKSQIIRKMAEGFPFTDKSNGTDVFIKWHIQCRDSGHNLQQELKVLTERLLKSSHEVNQDNCQNVVDNLGLHEAQDLVELLVQVNVPVVIIIEDPTSEEQLLLESLCRSLNNVTSEVLTQKFHIYVSSRQKNEILPAQEVRSCYILENVTGFNEAEAIAYLNGKKSPEKKDAAVKIFKRFGGLPLGLQVAKGYCKKARLSYGDYLELVDDVDYDIISKEKKVTMKEYGNSALHVFQAIVLPFTPQDEDDTTAVLPWKILCCICYFHYDRIPQFVLEQCCHVLREGNVTKPHSKNKAEVGSLISKLIDNNMCTETDEGEITFHEVVLNAFRLNRRSVLKHGFKPLEKALEIMCSLVSKDMRKKEHSKSMYKLRRHLHALLKHIEKDDRIFKDSKDPLLLKALTSYLHETAGAIMLNESPSFWKEAGRHFEMALIQIWPEMKKYSLQQLLNCNKTLDEIAQEVLESSKSKANVLPPEFTVKYASKLELCFDEKELEFLKKRSLCDDSFAMVEALLGEKGCTETMVKKLTKCGLFLPEEKYQPIFYAERFAFILHSWSRLVLYGEPEEVKAVGEMCIGMSNLSNRVSVECKRSHKISLLAEPLSRTGGWVPIVLKLKRSPEDLQAALNTCVKAMQQQELVDVYENGMLKEVYGPSHMTSRIQLLRYIVRINARLHAGATRQVEREAEKVCCVLFDLSVEHAKEISTCLMCLIYCAKYYAAKKDFEKAMSCFQNYFELESVCNPRFNVRCWAVYNYAKAVNAYPNCPSPDKDRAYEKCTEVLQSKDVMNKSLKQGLNDEVETLRSQN